MALLEVQGVIQRFGGLTALQGIDLAVEKGAVHAVIGPNGAGKTTLFNIITGVVRPTEGDVTMDGKSIAGLRPDQVRQRGIARTFQNLRLFEELTVRTNVEIGRHVKNRGGLTAAILRPGWLREEESAVQEETSEMLHALDLADVADTKVRFLSYGQRRRVEVARAMIGDPTVLLLDEPTVGMNHAESEELLGVVGSVVAQGVTVMLISHDMPMVMRISDVVTLIHFGEKVVEGSPQEVRNHPSTVEAYLGL